MSAVLHSNAPERVEEHRHRSFTSTQPVHKAEAARLTLAGLTVDVGRRDVPALRGETTRDIPSPMPWPAGSTNHFVRDVASSCRGRAPPVGADGPPRPRWRPVQLEPEPQPGRRDDLAVRPAGKTPRDGQPELTTTGTPISTRPRRVQPGHPVPVPPAAQKCRNAAPCASAAPTARRRGSTPPSSVASARSRATSPVAAMACSSTTKKQIFSPPPDSGRSAGRPSKPSRASWRRPRLLDEGDACRTPARGSAWCAAARDPRRGVPPDAAAVRRAPAPGERTPASGRASGRRTPPMA